MDLCAPQVRQRLGHGVPAKKCGHGDKEVGSSSAGMNRIKFVGFASSPEFLQDPCISAHQHTPEQARV
jgi:hypothetical protein